MTKQIGLFERYLSLWVALCIGLGILLGRFVSNVFSSLSEMAISGVNIPIAIFIWLMIYPMMLQIDFSSITNVKKNPKGLLLTVVINWLIKPFTMAFFAWVFFSKMYHAFIDPQHLDEYIAGAILLGAAPCTAMVFVWSYLTDGDANYTLVQVAVNDLLILVAFVPIVGFLLGITNITIPYETLISSVVLFVVVPLLLGIFTQKRVVKSKGKRWYQEKFIPRFKPFSIISLLMMLVLLFAFQGGVIVENPLIILLVAIPLILQTYFIFFLSWFGGKALKLPMNVKSPSSMIGASNFFELAVAVAIALFGLKSPAALVTVVGVLVEVPVMLSLVNFVNRSKNK